MSGIEGAFAAFKSICDFMQSANLEFEVPNEENIAFVTLKGEQFPVTLMFSVSAGSERVGTYCELPFTVKEEYELDFAKAVNAVNRVLSLGKFCYYPSEALCSFESSEYLSGLSDFTEEYGRILVGGAYTVIQDFISPLFEVASGRMTAREIQRIAERKSKKGA